MCLRSLKLFSKIYIYKVSINRFHFIKNPTALYMLSKTYTGKSYSVFGLGREIV